MSSFQLEDGVFSCVSNECLVFLDSNKMEYFQLDSSKTKLAFTYFEDKENGVNIDEKVIKLFNNLSNKKILKSSNVLRINQNENFFVDSDCIYPVESIFSLTFLNRDKLRFKEFLKVLSVNSYVRFKFKFFKKPLILKKGKVKRLPNDKEVVKLIGLYNSAQVFTPWKGINKCLVRSMALKYYLGLHGIDADLVIGVKTNPFLAHAWLQVGNVVINDEINKVGDYNPIMRIN